MVRYLSVKRRRLYDRDPIEDSQDSFEPFSVNESVSTGLAENGDSELSDSDASDSSNHGSYAGIVSTPELSEGEPENIGEVSDQGNCDSNSNGNYNGSANDGSNSENDKTYDTDTEDVKLPADDDTDDSRHSDVRLLCHINLSLLQHNK